MWIFRINREIRSLPVLANLLSLSASDNVCGTNSSCVCTISDCLVCISNSIPTLPAFCIVSTARKPINLHMKTGEQKSSRHLNCTYTMPPAIITSAQHHQGIVENIAWATMAVEMLNSWKHRKQLAKMLNVMAEAPQTIIIMIIKSTVYNHNGTKSPANKLEYDGFVLCRATQVVSLCCLCFSLHVHSVIISQALSKTEATTKRSMNGK